jgi:hypothetical protein
MLLSKQPLPIIEEVVVNAAVEPLSVQTRVMCMVMHVKICKALVAGMTVVLLSACWLQLYPNSRVADLIEMALAPSKLWTSRHRCLIELLVPSRRRT